MSASSKLSDQEERFTSSRVERNRQKVCTAAAELFVENSYDAVTIEMIIVRANVARSSFYRFFNDKEDLLKNILVPMFEFMADRIEAIDLDRPELIVNGIAESYIDAWDQFPNRLQLATTLVNEKNYMLVKDGHDRYVHAVIKVMERLNEVHLLRNDDPRLSTHLIGQVGIKILQVHLKHPYFENAYCSALRGLLLKW